METEQLEPLVGPLAFTVKAASRESAPAQKAAHLLEPDLRCHWSTGTNTKEWIVLELEEPCLLSHIRIYNKSVLEWEISAGLQYKPEAFVKMRPRCEAPRRDMIYNANYTACRYVRISCLRGNPISIYFLQLIGVSVSGLEAEFQPIVNHLTPHIISHKQEPQNVHLKLLQDIAGKLSTFLPYLETDLSNFTEDPDSSIQFLAMLAGPCYPLLRTVKQREAVRAISSSPEAEMKTSQAPPITVSSNFEVQSRRHRSSAADFQPSLCSLVFRPDVALMLLRKAYKDHELGFVCRLASLSLHKIELPTSSGIISTGDPFSLPPVDTGRAEASDVCLSDYSQLFGEACSIPDVHMDINFTSLLDISSIEEGIFHVLYACAAQPLLCGNLAKSRVDFLSILPLVQALLPAFRPPLHTVQDPINDHFSQWAHPLVLRALSQIVSMSSVTYYPLLRSSAGYLSSVSASQARAACVLIDLCLGALAPWLTIVVAKVDLVVELVEDLLDVIQGTAPRSSIHPRVALNYIILALSGYADDILRRYKEFKHKLLFLIEMLEYFLEPLFSVNQGGIASKKGEIILSQKQEESCEIALSIIRCALQKPAVLPYLERQWRRRAAAPSVLLSILGPNLLLPPEIDLCKPSGSKAESPHNLDESAESSRLLEVSIKMDMLDDSNLLFAPAELKRAALIKKSAYFVKDRDGDGNLVGLFEGGVNQTTETQNNYLVGNSISDGGFSTRYFDLQANYLQLLHYDDCQSRASEFRQLALDLYSEADISPEGHEAAIDALLLAAECYINPFVTSSVSKSLPRFYDAKNAKNTEKINSKDPTSIYSNGSLDQKTVLRLEQRRDKAFLEKLLQAAEMDHSYEQKLSQNNGLSHERRYISPSDIQHADSTTIVRQNQDLLCQFVIRYLKKDKLSIHETLLQSLLFILESATELCCPPEDVIDVILRSADHLNSVVGSYHHELRGTAKVDLVKLHGIQRHCMILQKLVSASLGFDEDLFTSSDGFLCRSLVPPKSWVLKIPTFSKFPSPLARFLGWKAVSLVAKICLRDQLFLSLNLSHLTSLLSIFGDVLALTEDICDVKAADSRLVQSGQSIRRHSFKTTFPELYRFFPTMVKQFMGFGETILQAVCLRLRSLPSAAVSDILCWFSEFCMVQFLGNGDERISSELAARNAKAVILFILEAVIKEHTEAMVLEMPRVAKILESLCRSPFCDVDFLDSVFALLKPLISYGLRKASQDELIPSDELSSSDLEFLCFGELFSFILQKCIKEEDFTGEQMFYSRSRVIFILGGIYPDLSFRRKKDLLLSLHEWADFTVSEPTTNFLDHLLAFQRLMNSCIISLAQAFENLGISIPCQIGQVDAPITTVEPENTTGLRPLSLVELQEISESMEGLIKKLSAALESCWGLHSKLTRKLTITTTKILLFLRCLTSSAVDAQKDSSVDFSSNYWVISMERVAEDILESQKSHFWQVASCMLDYVFGLGLNFSDPCLALVCTVIKGFICLAPRISWRLLPDKWLSSIFALDMSNLSDHDHLVDLVITMLGHWEPEQRSVALKHLGLLVESNLNKSTVDSITCRVVSGTWDRVASMVSTDPSVRLRAQALALLSGFVPFAEERVLRLFLVGAQSLPGLGNLAPIPHEDPFTRLSIALLANICLYSSFECVTLLNDDVWERLQQIISSKSGFYDIEKSICEALCNLRTDFDHAKEVLKGLLSSGPDSKQSDPAVNSVRESILQVASSLVSVQAYYDFLSQKVEKEAQELDEAEIELELLQKEKALQNMPEGPDMDESLSTNVAADSKDGTRLQQIKEEIRSIEKSKLKEEIIARRQRKLLQMKERQKFLEDAALREMELLQELDRERISEAEREIERKRLLETERAKTRELRCNLELEREKRAQRDLQKELEQVESGAPPARRDFSSNPIRPRDRYRERDNGRTMAPENSAATRGAAATSRSPPFTILQPTDRADDRAPIYEDFSYEGSRDSGDGGSVGDPETAASLEGGGFGGAPRQGRGGRSRQILERREREGSGRREGKWERKNS
ncbi:uncharacterized protein LOC144711878 isoform X2 [Wolffia australiana]